MASISAALEQEIAEALEHLRIIAQHDTEGAMARILLREVVDLAVFPTELAHQTSLAPPLYNPGTRRFEFQRTPNVFVLVDDLTCVAGVDIAITQATLNDPIPAVARDGATWKVLGGLISSSAASMVDLKDGAGGRVFFHGVIPATLVTPFTLPGNGYAMLQNRPINVNHEVGGVVDLMLFVAEESDTQGRGGA